MKNFKFRIFIVHPQHLSFSYLLQKIDNMRPANQLSIILDNNRLTGPNFIDWLRNLKVVLAFEKILYVIEQGLPLSLDRARPTPIPSRKFFTKGA